MKALEKIKQGFRIIAVLSLVLSCRQSWLDEKPELKTVIPTTLADCQALLDNNGVMNFNAGPGLNEVASDGHYLTEAAALTYLRDNDRNAYVWSELVLYNNVLSDWNLPYIKIFYCNLILETLNKIERKPSTSLEWDNIKGQALFIRSKSFYDLAQLYVPVYQTSVANLKFGLPLRLESDINIKSVRSTVQQTYDQIISDLLVAKDLMPNDPLFKTRGSKTAALALLSRVYLSMGDYANAGTYSDLALKQNDVLLNYRELSIPATAVPFNRFHAEVIFHDGFYYSSIRQFNIDENLYTSYKDEDIRKTAFFTTKSGNTHGWRGNYTGVATSFFNGLSIDELYLIRSECFARAGDANSAMHDLNNLLRNRYIEPYADIIVANADEALIRILEERKKELLFRGLRWSDMRRLNLDPRFALNYSRTLAGVTYVLEPNSYKYTFPIPNDIIEMTGMEQNPDWLKY